LILPLDDRKLVSHVERNCGFDSFHFPHPRRSETGRLGECRPAQLAVFKRNVPRPKLNKRDRLFWIGLYLIWQDWKSALIFVQPETVTSWHRKRFKRYWWRLSQPKQLGRPRIRSEIRKLIHAMAIANPTWGAPRVHGELKKLG
jgi:putative transposase